METFLKANFRESVTLASQAKRSTIKAGRDYAVTLKPGDVVALSGNLGAGKTHFVKGVASYFGIKEAAVVSPTFGLVREYEAAGIKIYHFDFYRLQSMQELEKTGFCNYLREPCAVLLAEWPEMVEQTWPDFNRAVRIEHAGQNRRTIIFYERRSPALMNKSGGKNYNKGDLRE
ncbi:MAG: tRNA (adenosine(37)-N6)-threonylcarbamoyltransferase complex ATPase subunit type 1 TsaE [Spirochaetia bacterium]|nr:tRNA (adenosine(37)-N6)-threonylcarbamoyltransferase complex ATPase subunit type 1 TsaE [Spirochaetia bacterium]